MRADRENATSEVITAFLWDGRRILLALRSDAVSTFPGHWAGISGYIEGEQPVERALVEVSEECGIGRGQLTLRAAGEPIDVPDQKSGRTFRVHPFLFSVTPDLQPRPDWEARRLEWADVAEMLDRRRQPVVPKLYETFESIWPPWPVDRAVEVNVEISAGWLRDDRTMGAGRLARAAAIELAKMARLCTGVDSGNQLLLKAILSLRAARPSMAAPVNMMQDLLSDFEISGDAKGLAAAVDRRIQATEAAQRETARRAAEQLGNGDRVMTHS